jgi:hypothetical protein
MRAGSEDEAVTAALIICGAAALYVIGVVVHIVRGLMRGEDWS